MQKRILWAPFALAAVFMVPRLLSPQFGFLDDATTLLYGRQLTSSVLALLKAFTAIGDTGRFIPAYWLYYSAVYWLGWANPFLFFLANASCLMLIVGGIIFFVRYRGGSRIQAAIAASLFVLSGPVLESFYTGSQEGPPQLVLLCAALALLAVHDRARTKMQRALVDLGLFLAMFGANCTMETSVVMAGIAVAWYVTARLCPPAAEDRLSRGALVPMMVTGALAVVTWFLLRMRVLHLSLNGGSYTSGYMLSGQRIFVTGTGYLSYFVRDFLYIVPLMVPVFILMRRGKQRQTRLILDALAWISAWTLIYLPWQSALEYYILPCTIGFAILGGVAAGQLIELFQADRAPYLRALGIAFLALVGIGCINNYSNGRYEMTMDRSNNSLLDFLATLPLNSKILVNIPNPSEYEYEIGLHLAESKARPDLAVDYFHFQTPTPAEQAFTYYVVTPQVKNEPHPSLRYALYATGADQWNRSLSEFLGRKDLRVFRIENQMQLLDFGLHRFVCMFAGPQAGLYCFIPRPFIDSRILSYGWDIYRVSRRAEEVSQPGIFLHNGSWVLRSFSGAIHQIQFGEAGDRPVTGDWLGTGRTGIGVFRPGNRTWYLDADLDGKPDIVFHSAEMREGDIPIVGDWFGRGKSAPGYFRPIEGTWHFLSDFKEGKEEQVFSFGAPDNVPVVGDWTGSGRDAIGVYRQATGEFAFQDILAQKAPNHIISGVPGAVVAPGDWTGSGKFSVAFVAGDHWTLRVLGDGATPSNQPEDFTFGPSGGSPVVGKWRF